MSELAYVARFVIEARDSVETPIDIACQSSSVAVALQKSRRHAFRCCADWGGNRIGDRNRLIIFSLKAF
jgi:hypothetical protein